MKSEKKKKNGRLTKDEIIRDIRTFFEQEEDYYKPKWVSSFWYNNYMKTKVMVIKTATYHSMNILIKLNLIEEYNN